MTTEEYEAQKSAWWDVKTADNVRRAGEGQRRYYAQQQEAARVANYRLAWSQDRGGYFAQWRGESGQWYDVGPVRASTADASLDAKLNANQCGQGVRMHPQIANLTEGRSEYGDVDLNKPFPGW